jgi:D-tyrosyl-tRNA(Tyr) deacylase
VRVLLQRVRAAHVEVTGTTVGEIGPGLLIFLGVGQGDSGREANVLAAKIARLRVFSDDAGRMNRSVREAGNAALVVSQFTLYADASRGNRPSFFTARPAQQAERLVRALCLSVASWG